MGVLEVSRSIGDGAFKVHGVSSTPDVKKCQLTANDRYAADIVSGDTVCGMRVHIVVKHVTNCYTWLLLCLQCFDAVYWVAGRAYGL